MYSFPAGSSDPYTGLIQGNEGDFYGTTGAGGASDAGTVFKITPTGTETVLHAFANSGSDGQIPYAGLIQGSDGANPSANMVQSSVGNLYGSTDAGGVSGYGTFFKVTLQ